MDKKETLVKKLKNELHESDSYISELQLKIKNEAEKSEELRKELNTLSKKNIVLSEYVSEIEQKLSDDITNYKNEISELNNKIESKSNLNKENEEKMNKISKEHEKCKTELNLINIKIINYEKEIENKNSVIYELEKTNIRLSENISEFSELQNKYIIDNSGNIENEIKIAKKDEHIEYLNKENIFLITEIDKLKKRNSYIELELSKLNHKNFELQTCINTLKNSKPFINNTKDSTDDCCSCVCF